MSTQFSKSSLATGIALALLLSACGESSSSSAGEDYGTPPPVDTSFDESKMVENIVDNVITPTFVEFATQSQVQANMVSSYCQMEQDYADGNAELDQVNSSKTSARDAWQTAMTVWQKAEVMQLGPLLENDSLLRNNIYSWPNVNSCAVDYDVTFFKSGEVNGAPYDITQRTASRKGLAALEYLLFNDNLADSCASGSPDNWNNQTETYRKIARCEFATEVANDIHNNATHLVSVWNANDGYANELKTAGTAASSIATAHDAVNRISDAMFYIDSKTKDGKLALPLGLVLNDCGGAPCPESVESLHANASIEHITNNLRGFEHILTGGEGSGFVDFLIESNAQDLAEQMVADVANAISDAEGYTTTLAETLVLDSAKVEQTHADVKKVTDQLKTDFINSLALELPKTSAGDND